MWRPEGLEDVLLESFLKPCWKFCVVMTVSTREEEWRADGLAIAWRKYWISGIGSISDRSKVP